MPYLKFKGSIVKGLTHSRMAKHSSLKTHSPSTRTLNIVLERQPVDASKQKSYQITDDDSTIIGVAKAVAEQ